MSHSTNPRAIADQAARNLNEIAARLEGLAADARNHAALVTNAEEAHQPLTLATFAVERLAEVIDSVSNLDGAWGTTTRRSVGNLYHRLGAAEAAAARA